MSTIDARIIIVAIFGLVAIFAFLRFRKQVKVEIDGPGNTKLRINGSNDSPAGIRGRNLKSRTGGLTVQDETGHGADIEAVDVATDINITATSQPPKV